MIALLSGGVAYIFWTAVAAAVVAFLWLILSSGDWR